MRQAGFLVMLVWVGISRAQAPSPEEVAGFERILSDNHLPSAGPELLTFFRSRTLSQEQIAQLSAHVEGLGSQVYSQRSKAAAALVKAGQLAKPLLVALIKDPAADVEAVRRAELCLRQINDGNEAMLAVATAHLIVRDKPDQAALVLVRYTPFATDPETIEAVQLALNALAVKSGKPEPDLVAALRDKVAQVRAAAGEALVRGGGLKNKALVEHLLADPLPQVRLQVALALAEARDQSAIPVLIELLAELPGDRAWLAEELLGRLAGDDGPLLSLANRTSGLREDAQLRASARQVRAAWQEWWQKHEADVDWARLGGRLQGYTLVTMSISGRGLNGRVMELGPNQEVHWKIEWIRYPLDAQVIGRDRVLIAEYFGNRVTERDFKGNVLWEVACSMPLSCQRFPSGETFIVLLRGLLLVDSAGKELFTYYPANGTMAAGQRSRNGHMTFVTSSGHLQVLDPRGKEVRSFQVGPMPVRGSNIELLPGGRVLVPLDRENRVVEYDANGKIAWQAAVQNPTTATRLPNGHTLIASSSQQRLVEIDSAGKEIWSFDVEGRPWRVTRR